ncbi:MAG: bifunctional metallophosphatase/5'-nucleotidase [Coriobacteriia bacterium]|nr:bifunctional metallophosphatase/5'-nucleotidase [Coriobacteriia bacterium]
MSLNVRASTQGAWRLALMCSFVLLVLAALVAGLAPKTSIAASPAHEEISILFTHDLHSHYDPESFFDNGKPAERGGYARLATAIEQVKRNYPASFVFDAGDFAMGTLYQTIYSSEASELRIMGQMGYDALTFGNHEYDYRAQGANDMLTAALASKDTLPALTIANIDWEATFAMPELKEDALALQAALERYGNSDYLIIEKGGVRLAVFGLMGISSANYAPVSGLIFSNPIEAAGAVVKKIQAEAEADIIICLSHSGTYDNPKESEDELLASAVPDIDLIVSGHTHTRLAEPIYLGNTAVVSSGQHGYELGHVVLAQEGDRFKVSSYELIPIRESLAKNAQVDKAVDGFRELVDDHYLSLFDYEFDQMLAFSPFDFTPIESFGLIQGEEPLGNLIADSYREAVRQAEGSAYQEVDIAVVPRGVIRGSFATGPITVSDAYNVSSLGIGPDRVPGYPLVSIYLTGEELKTMAEVDISVSTLMIDARLYVSGLSYTYNPNRLLLNRVTDVQLMSPEGTLSELDSKKLYRVVGGLYSCQMLGEVESRSFGLLKVVPKDADGEAIVDFEQHIVYSGGRELKEWVALADYLVFLSAQYGSYGLENYNQDLGRKIENNSTSLPELLKNPNHIFFILLAVVVVLLLILVVVTALIVRTVRRRKKKRNV